ncbi:MAG: GNAT family N-acetyltransferase [Clostridia bacterium]|nr:GNAT family N-acetyltransferase [Clostridia bacterium]
MSAAELCNTPVEYAHPNDRLALRELFDSCFPGESEFSRWFFDCVWSPETTLTLRIDGLIVSALQMLPMELEYDRQRLRGCYVFAVGTHPGYEGRGLAGRLLERSFEIGRSLGLDFSALIVQRSPLISFYSRFGYKPVFEVGSVELTPQPFDGETVQLDRSHIPEIDRLYRESVGGMLFDVRDTDRWRRQMDAYKVLGTYTNGRLTGYCFFDTRGGGLFAAEACGESARALVAGAAYKEGKKSAKMLTPVREEGGREAIGCLKTLSERAEKAALEAQRCYLNLYYN